MNYEVTVYLNSQQNLYHLSGVLTGLWQLAAEGSIHLNQRLGGAPSTGKAPPVDALCLCMHIETAEGVKRDVCIDLHDISSRIALEILERSDAYFKRSYHLPDLAPLTEDLRLKVKPFGLNYACRSKTSTYKVFRSLGPASVHAALWEASKVFMKEPKRALALAHERLYPLRQFQTSPSVQEFEQRPAQPVDDTILFQTRVWHPSEVLPDDPAEINDGRAQLVRALREAFGDKFRGGLVPTPYAQQNYPDLLTEEQHKRKDYVRMSRTCKVGVYTRGLHHSLAFKLPEYLASAKCIVSDPMRNTLPEPLAEEKNYLCFTDTNQCIEQCRRLLSDSSLSGAMRQANYDYYQREVQPSAHLLSCIRRAFL